MQLCNLRFQDGCFENQYATYLLRSMTPKFLSAGRWCNLPTFDSWMGTFTECNLPTSKHIPKIFVCRRTMQPTNLGFLDGCLHSMQPTYFEAHTQNFRLSAPDATLQPLILGWMLWKSVCNLPTSEHHPQIFVCRQTMQPTNLGFLDGYLHSMQPTYFEANTQNFCLPHLMQPCNLRF